MQPGANGFRPVPGALEENLAQMHELSDAGMPAFDLIEFQPLLDSSNMSPKDWLPIANQIAVSYSSYDGFVVLHGTDTMAYTASALPLMLQGLAKPVILTGSQIPLCELRNDARENLITAMLLAAHYKIPEVCIYFSGRLIRGCRSTKISAHLFEAFDSPNYPLLGSVGTSIEIDYSHILSPPEGQQEIHLRNLESSRVGTLRLFPGITAEVVGHFLSQPLDGLVLETFGSGNGPSNDKDLLKVLQDRIGQGVVVVAVTQCGHGRVELEGYATGHALADAGVVSGKDMTVEAALTKLFYLYSCRLPVEQIRQNIGKNFVGELTESANDFN